MKLIITVDTEADNQWSRKEALELKNIDYIPRFQALCDSFLLKPTYLTTYAMATSDKFVHTVGPYQEAGKAEIGAHLHPWSTPPLIPLTDNDHAHHPFPHEYPREVLKAKLSELTNAIEEKLGQRPLTFRAGRYGFDTKVAALLAELGYWADCSVTPLVSWRKIPGAPQGNGGPDFAAAPPYAYEPSSKDVTRPGSSGLLEVPVTIFFWQWPLLNRLVRIVKRIYNDRQDVLLRGLYKFGYKPTWFRPHPQRTVYELLQVYRMVRQLKFDYVEMIFHSSELMPGGSKNTRDEASVEAIYRLLEEVFSTLTADKVQSVTLTEYARAKRSLIHESE